MPSVPTRIVIYAKDIACITGMQPDTARKLLSRIRHKQGKSKRSLITVFEFCEHMGFKPEWVLPFLHH